MKLPRLPAKWWKPTAPPSNRKLTYTATIETPGTATTISLTAGQPLPETVTVLQHLVDVGWVEHEVDDMGVVRWRKAEPNVLDLKPPF